MMPPIIAVAFIFGLEKDALRVLCRSAALPVAVIFLAGTGRLAVTAVDAN
jgi:hypothetical protein